MINLDVKEVQLDIQKIQKHISDFSDLNNEQELCEDDDEEETL